MTQEFHISITPVGKDQYLVQTEQVAPKVPLAEALVILPLTDWLTQSEQLINDALNAVLQSDEKQLVTKNSDLHPLDSPLQSKIINLGQQLYNALFQGSLKDSWIKAKEIAQKEQEVLRLRLELNEPVLVLLPWEILHTGDRFLATDPSIAFSRYQTVNQGETIEMPTPVLQQGVVKVLMAIAMPNPQDRLTLKQEATKLQAELRQVSQADNFGSGSGKTQFQATRHKASVQLEKIIDSALIDPATELDFLDEEEWDQVRDQESGIRSQAELDFLDEEKWEQDDPGYEEDSALVSDLFRQVANQPTGPELPLVPDSACEQLPEVASSDPQSLRSEIPQTCGDKSHKLAETPLDLPSAESTPATTDTSTQRSQKLEFLNAQSVRKILPVLQAVGVTAIALMGFWWFQNRQLQQISYPPTPPVSQSANDNLKTASSSELQAIAIEHFHKGNLNAGSLVVEELLNRGALPSAKTALNTVSDLQAETSTINFLRGRLAWQSIKAGDKNYSLDDVRRYWETGVKHNPDSPSYYNALGFVYYSQGDLNKANQTWFQALYLIEEQKAKKTASTPVVAKRDELNAYAGLALVLSKSAKNQPINKQAKLLSEAIKLRQQVVTDDPINFQPQTLSKTWLWTEKAIQDWRSLLQFKGG